MLLFHICNNCFLISDEKLAITEDNILRHWKSWCLRNLCNSCIFYICLTCYLFTEIKTKTKRHRWNLQNTIRYFCSWWMSQNSKWWSSWRQSPSGLCLNIWASLSFNRLLIPRIPVVLFFCYSYLFCSFLFVSFTFV